MTESETLLDMHEHGGGYQQLARLSVEDIAHLLDESERAFLPPASHPGRTAWDMIEEFQRDPAFILFGYTDSYGNAQTYIAGRSHTEPGAIRMGPMYVSRRAQGQGVGKQQMVDFASTMFCLGYRSIYTQTWAANKASLAAMRSVGFTETLRIPDDRVNGDTSVGLQLHQADFIAARLATF